MKKNRNDKFRGIPFHVKYIERVRKEKFDETNYNFVKSKHHKEAQQPKRIKNKKKAFDYFKHKNEINKELHAGIILKVGCYGKNRCKYIKTIAVLKSILKKLL